MLTSCKLGMIFHVGNVPVRLTRFMFTLYGSVFDNMPFCKQTKHLQGVAKKQEPPSKMAYLVYNDYNKENVNKSCLFVHFIGTCV